MYIIFLKEDYKCKWCNFFHTLIKPIYEYMNEPLITWSIFYLFFWLWGLPRYKQNNLISQVNWHISFFLMNKAGILCKILTHHEHKLCVKYVMKETLIRASKACILRNVSVLYTGLYLFWYNEISWRNWSSDCDLSTFPRIC